MRAARRDLLKGVARIFLAAALLLGFIASTLPLATIASGPMCTLACCAGRAPHAAGSCMNGSCHAVLSNLPRKNPSAPRYQLREQLCGLSRFSQTNFRVTRTVLPANKTIQRQTETRTQAQLSAHTIATPCEPGCGSGAASAFGGSHRERTAGALSNDLQPRPTLLKKRINADLSRVKTVHLLCRECAPRPPPTPLA